MMKPTLSDLPPTLLELEINVLFGESACINDDFYALVIRGMGTSQPKVMSSVFGCSTLEKAKQHADNFRQQYSTDEPLQRNLR